MGRTVKKEEVEELLGYRITKSRFQEALKLAKNKQEYIYRQEKRPVILQQWYLLKLTEEYIRSLAFSEKTADLCRMLRNMEKEHPTNSQGAPTSTHIITGSAL